MSTLHLATGLRLPLHLVTESVGILAKRRAGKSTTARRLAEQLHQAKQQVVVADPKGDWWGLLFARDGKSPGLPFVVLGGEHGHIPLEVGAGELVAKMVVTERVSLVLDLSQFRKHEVATFMTAFMENLYRLKAQEQYRTPLMLIIDEADAIAPQKPQRGEERMLGAAEDLVRRGGQRGIGVTMITQRSAVLNKNVLTQIGILIVLRTIAPQDIKAMKAWIDLHGTEAQGAALIESLPSLPTGTGWVWAPGWPETDGIFDKYAFLLPDTFDSSKTPGQSKTVVPKHAADVDLAAFQREMAATIEKAKQDDPRELRKQLAEAQRMLVRQEKAIAELQARPAAGKEKRVEVPVLKDGQLVRAEKILAHIENLHAGFRTQLEALVFAGKELEVAIRQTHTQATMTQRVGADRPQRQSPLPSPHGRRAVPAATARRPASVHPSSNGELSRMHRAMLIALAQHEGGLTKKQIHVHTGYASSGSTSAAFADLAREGWAAADGNRLRITGVGLDVLGPYDPLPVGDALRNWLLDGDKLSTMEKALLARICAAYPGAIKKGLILEQAEYASSGSTSAAFAKLVAYNYAIPQGASMLKAAEELFS